MIGPREVCPSCHRPHPDLHLPTAPLDPKEIGDLVVIFNDVSKNVEIDDPFDRGFGAGAKMAAEVPVPVHQDGQQMSLVAPHMPDAEYRATNALSVSGAKLLLPPNCPALYYWRLTHQQPHKQVFDFGHLAHKLVLGDGPDLSVIEADSWRTKAAQTERDEAYAAGRIPVLAAEFDTAMEMADSVKNHPVASTLIRQGYGKPEVSMFWQDESGVPLRGRVDWLPNAGSDRLVLVDLKTAASADPSSFARSAANYGYAMQAAWYIDGAKALGLSDDPSFVFVVVEKTAPYLVSVLGLDPDDIRIARGLNQRAIRIFKDCNESGHWPGYEGGVVGMPGWWRFEHDDDMEMV